VSVVCGGGLPAACAGRGRAVSGFPSEPPRLRVCPVCTAAWWPNRGRQKTRCTNYGYHGQERRARMCGGELVWMTLDALDSWRANARQPGWTAP